MTKPRLSNQPRAVSRRRRGVALLIVMLLLSMTLGLSYAAMRSQHTAMLIHRNFDCRESARQAARTGLSIAIQKMSTTQWNGVGTALTGELSAEESFEVSYTLGDPTLSDDDLANAYRVTLLSTGKAADPGRSETVTQYQIRAVMGLAPRTLADEPFDWKEMQDYTVFQTDDVHVPIDIPARIEGPVRLQKKLKIAGHYPNYTPAWERYLSDLNAMQPAGRPDYRPLDGPVDLPVAGQDANDLFAMGGLLGVSVGDVPTQVVASDWIKPVSLAGYQIYQGGPVYIVPQVGGPLENVTLEADPWDNPLGVFYCDSSITIGNNVTIRGSLFCRNDINIEGTDIVFEPVAMPALHGSDAPVRLPVVSCENFHVKPLASVSVTGLVAVFNKFEVQQSADTTELELTGRLVTCQLELQKREPWADLPWDALYAEFVASSSPYFPVWMGEVKGYDPTPRITIKPEKTDPNQPAPDPIDYHWYNWNNQPDPIYDPNSGDGLRWDLLQWTENPET